MIRGWNIWRWFSLCLIHAKQPEEMRGLVVIWVILIVSRLVYMMDAYLVSLKKHNTKYLCWILPLFIIVISLICFFLYRDWCLNSYLLSLYSIHIFTILTEKQREFYKNAKCVNKYKKSQKQQNKEQDSSQSTRFVEVGLFTFIT